MMGRRSTLIALIALAGCDANAPNVASSQSPPAASSSTNTIVMITITDYQYIGPDSVFPGATIVVMNESEVNHTVTAAGEGAFNVTVMAGGSAAFTAPSRPGRYVYTCAFHPGVIFTLVVS